MSSQNLGKKKKEKPLDIEDAIQLAQAELAPFWHGATPQLVSIEKEDQYILLPLDALFYNTSWLICCIDPTTLNNDLFFSYIQEWDRRYHHHPIKIMLIFSQNYSFLKDPTLLAQRALQKQSRCTVTIDIHGTLFPALNALGNLKILLLHGKNRYFEYEEELALQKAEKDLQSFLRSTNPGLPLLPTVQLNSVFLKDEFRLEFGKDRLSIPIGNGAFIKSKTSETLEGQFTKLSSQSEILLKNELSLSGQWEQNYEKITTADSQAEMVFTTEFTELGIVAGSELFAKSSNFSIECLVSVSMDSNPVHKKHMGKDLLNHELGMSLVTIGEPRLYSILTNLPKGLHRIQLKFVNAQIGPIAIYGIRFSNK